mgnify:CR=1 FL=1
MDKLKISVIGAGSAVFSMNLVKDLCLTDGLKGSTVCFMDIDKKRLDMVYGLARRYANEVNANLKFEKTLDRSAALQDADFVINTALVTSHAMEEMERACAEKYGYYRGIVFQDFGDFGILGSCLHQLKFMLEVAEEMEDVCPDAWLIQASNPVFLGCTLMTRKTRIKVIGLCHGHYGVFRIAEVLGLDPKKVTFQAPGVNHCIWMTHFYYEGRDAYPLLDEWIEKKAEEYWKTWDGSPLDVQLSPAAVNLYKLFGLFPIGDTPRFAGAWWYHTDLETKKKWFNKYGGFDSEIGWNYYLNGLRKKMEKMFQIYENPLTKVSSEIPPSISGEQHIPIIDAIVNDNKGEFQVNVPNKGAIEGIADDVVVEVPAIVSARGVQTIHVGSLPKHLTLHILRTHVIPMEMCLEALLTGDKRILLNMILSDHRTKSYEQACKVLDAILNLPFNEDLKKIFQ